MKPTKDQHSFLVTNRTYNLIQGLYVLIVIAVLLTFFTLVSIIELISLLER